MKCTCRDRGTCFTCTIIKAFKAWQHTNQQQQLFDPDAKKE